MKKTSNHLFKKFEDEVLVKNALSIVKGGAQSLGSNKTGDHDDSHRNGQNSDCTDNDTDGIFDTVMNESMVIHFP